MKNKFSPMKKLIAVLLLTFSFAANATTYYVSSSGNDANSGTSTSSPWKTLSKVNSFFSSLKAGDIVLFNRGNTFYGSLTPKKSGTSSARITIGAYGSGAQPVITGFTSVSSWTKISGNIWESSSTVSSLSSCNMVTIGGVNRAMGRYPNTGFLTYSYSSSTSITCTSLNSGTTNWNGAEVVVRDNNWNMDRCKITAHSGTKLTYKNLGTGSAGVSGYGCFIQNDVRTLDTQNEWYYNPSTRKIRVYSTSTPSNVQVASVSRVLYNNGYDYITFDNISFTGSSDDAIYFESGSTSCTVQNCTISFCGQKGIILQSSSSSTINNNVIKNCNMAGISNFSGSNVVITNNSISNIGVVVGQSFATGTSNGIYTTGSNVSIKYNSIRNIAKNGMNFSNVGGGTMQYNFIDSACMILDDGAGIYVFGVNSSKRTLDHNIILNVNGHTSGTPNSTSLSEGIFLDEFASNVTVTNNTVANCTGYAGLKMFKAHDNIITNNTCYNNAYGIYIQDATGSNPGKIYNITFRSNIFVSRLSNQYVLGFLSPNNTIKGSLNADSNYYARPLDDNLTFYLHPSTGTSTKNLAGWQSYTAKDAHAKKSPRTTTNVNDLRFEYNATSSNKTVSLGATYIDMKNKSYNGSITLAPYSSAVLIKTGASSGNQPPVANAGADQAITSSSATLSGSGSDPEGGNLSYKWTKLTGSPSQGAITSTTSASTGVTGLVQGTYQFQLTVTDDHGLVTSDVVQIAVNVTTSLLPAVNPANAVVGMDYKYYQTVLSSLPVFSSLTPTKTGTTTNFLTSVASRTTNYAINFTGYVSVPSDGQYTFYTTSDDGSNLLIDNHLVVNNDGLHGPVERSGTIGLKAGKHAIAVGYFQLGQGVTLNVNYSGPGVSKRAVSSSQLYRISTSGLVALDNNSSISSITQASIKVYPNPFTSYIELNITGGVAGDYKLVLVDASGKLVWTKTGSKAAGAFQQTINTSNLTSGIYFLKVVQNNTSSTIKLAK